VNNLLVVPHHYLPRHNQGRQYVLRCKALWAPDYRCTHDTFVLVLSTDLSFDCGLPRRKWSSTTGAQPDQVRLPYPCHEWFPQVIKYKHNVRCWLLLLRCLYQFLNRIWHVCFAIQAGISCSGGFRRALEKN